MRVIALSTLRKYWLKHPLTEEPLKSWSEEVSNPLYSRKNHE